MQETNDRFCQEVVGERKLDAVDGVYTEGARMLPPGAPILEGREAIKRFWQAGIVALGITGAKLTTLDVEMAGDTAVEIGQVELQLEEKETASAKYIVHWKQQHGLWLWDKDIWNMN
jgi:ketosteroid isomerase-like protein